MARSIIFRLKWTGPALYKEGNPKLERKAPTKNEGLTILKSIITMSYALRNYLSRKMD